jgi:ABC-2 type transport system permease protein
VIVKTVKVNAPSGFARMKALLRADTITQLHQRPTVVMSVLLPLFFLNAWKRLIPFMGPDYVLAGCISMGLPSIGLMGYALVIARDRENGVFQRLRTTPCPTWMIMLSRLLVQLVLMLVMTAITLIAAVYIDGIHTGIEDIPKVLAAVVISGLLILSLGQFVAALFTSAESVNAATRMVYALVLIAGAIAETSHDHGVWHNVVQWSPLNVTKLIIAMAFSAAAYSRNDLMVILAAFAYTSVFAIIGTIYFRWK